MRKLVVEPEMRSAARVYRPRRYRSLIVAGALALAVTGCTAQVAGDAVAGKLPSQYVTPDAPASGPESSLESKSLTPQDFPSTYPAIRVPDAQRSDILSDVTGANPGAQIFPPNCAPGPLDPSKAIVLNGLSDKGVNLTVVTAQVDSPLSTVIDRVRSCPIMSVRISAVMSVVTTSILAPSPVDSQEKLAFRRQVRSLSAPSQAPRNSTVLIAQNNGIRVYAALMSTAGDRLDGEALDAVFTKAVEASRKG